jgi:arsenite-transporting ATPase
MSDGQQLHLIGGKGGSGKSTVAAAFALDLAERHPKETVLLAATEPSLALSDVLKKKLSAKPAKVVPGKGTGGLFAAELDPKALVKAVLPDVADALTSAAVKGALLSGDDVGKLLAQAGQNLEELAVLLWAIDQLEAGKYDRIVLDTQATSHTLRLLDVPVQLRKLIGLLRAEKPGKRREFEPSPIEDLAQRLERAVAFVRDPAKSAFHLVALAEPAPEAQTRHYFAQLRERQVPVTEILVNAIEAPDGCPACQGRRGLQAPHVRKYLAIDKTVPVVLLGRREVAPRGVEALKKFAKEALSGKETKPLEFAASEGPPALVRAPSMAPIAAPPITPTRLIFFVGQGGVGKSSCAAAAAVTLTEKEGPVLLISTEPSHSLSDVLQSRLTDVESQVKGTKGLYARELDFAGWFNNFRKRLKEKTDKAFDASSRSDASQDRDVLRNLIDVAPAGLEDLPSLVVLTDALIQERFKRIVVDPAPTGAGLRLLQLPEVARAWLTPVLAILMKYRAKGLGDLAEEINGLLKHVKRFEDALASPNEARFVVVSRGDELAAARTERLVKTLQARKLNVERVLVNRVLPKSTCEKCESRRKGELAAAKAMEKKIGVPITMAPALGRHPAGLRELKAFRTAWYALSAPNSKTKAA